MRLITLCLCCLLLVGCGSSVAHSDYYVVTYPDGGLQPAGEGKVAFDHALRQAGSRRPAQVLIEAAISESPANASAMALIRQRVAAAAKALQDAGASPDSIKPVLRPVADAEFAQRRNSLSIQLAYGRPPPAS